MGNSSYMDVQHSEWFLLAVYHYNKDYCTTEWCWGNSCRETNGCKIKHTPSHLCAGLSHFLSFATNCDRCIIHFDQLITEEMQQSRETNNKLHVSQNILNNLEYHKHFKQSSISAEPCQR